MREISTDPRRFSQTISKGGLLLIEVVSGLVTCVGVVVDIPIYPLSFSVATATATPTGRVWAILLQETFLRHFLG